jgi:inhibitor of cysteine peptidase
MTALMGGLMCALSAAYSDRGLDTMLSLVEKDNDRTVDILVGGTVQINLPENASTGYRWAVDHFDEEFITALSPEARYTAKGIGSGGEIRFIFQGKKVGTGEIVLKNWRQWEGDSSVIGRFRLHVRVQP